MPLPRLAVPLVSSLVLTTAVACAAGACSSVDPAATTGTTTGAGGASSSAVTTTGSAGQGGASTTTTGTTGSTTGAGGSAACPQAATMLDVSQAPGAGAGYPKPTLTATCTDTMFIVEGNGIPTYTFVQTTPNALVAQTHHWEITRNPVEAAQTTKVPLLGLAGFAVNGEPFFGPNEGAVPAAEAYGDPVYNGIMDPCFGHTSNEYHYHSMLEKCLIPGGLVAEPWTSADPSPSTGSPILGWAMDGFPIYGSRECADAACSKVVVMQSGFATIGNPKTNAWDAYQWESHPGDESYLDACNGHHGPNGDYHYHVTSGFPYIISCYRGTPMGQGGGMMGMDGGMMGMDGGGMMGPKSCTMASDCVGACPQGSIGCTCGNSPMGQICVPTCNTAADCPPGPMGQALKCTMGTCHP